MRTPLDLLLFNAAEVFTATDAGTLTDVVVGVRGGAIAYVGPEAGLPGAGFEAPATARIDCAGGVLTPGFVDSHTHVVFAGDRGDEFAMRAQGATYLEIARAGGGIASTMRATRAASLDALVDEARPRLARMLALGVTTVEVKSGYGLSTEAELKMLEAVSRLNDTQPIDLVPTFLGAHTVPPDRKADRARYLDEVVQEMIPAVAERGLAEFCDVFVEEAAFSLDEAERVLRAGAEHGLRPKVHADQLSAGGGTELAARLGAVSADHLEYVSADAMAAMAEAGTVAVLLPGCALFLDHTALRAPARALIDAGVSVALATDCNPGTCFTEHLPLIATLGVTWLKLTPEEALRAITIEGARALDRADRVGAIAVGRPADIVVHDAPNARRLVYHFAARHARMVFKAGDRVV